MNTSTSNAGKRGGPLAIALLIALGLAGCVGASATTEADPAPREHPASVRLSLEQQRALNLLVNDDDPRGLHGMARSDRRSIGASNTVESSPAPIDRQSTVTPHGLRSDPSLPQPEQRRTVNDDDPRGLHDLTTNGW